MLLVAIVAASLGVAVWSKQKNREISKLGASVSTATTLVGTSVSYKQAPTSSLGLSSGFYNGSSTTTLVGDTWIQDLNTDGSERVTLNIAAIGGTGTSTFYIRPMVSFDGINYYFPQNDNIALFVTTTINSTTTTLPNIPKTLVFVPGTTSSTVSYVFNLSPYKYARFMFLGDDVALDPNDGVRAFITYGVK